MVLVTGANGFVGYYLCKALAKNGNEVLATGKGDARIPLTDGIRYETLDFTDAFAVHDICETYQPTAIIHAGAMGKPDECELHQWDAHQTNVEGTMHLALKAAELGAYFLLISTDFVFDGKTGMYSEEDPLNPVNFYGNTKKLAEELVQEFVTDYGIVRTVLVYGAPQTGRTNLLSIVKEKMMKGEKYSVVNDQVRTPTYVEDLVDGIIAMLRLKARGIFHICGEEVFTPYELVMEMARLKNLDSSSIDQVSTAQLQHPAQRPMRTGLNITKAKTNLGYQPKSFADALIAMNVIESSEI